jgi:hypothetical protein
MNNQSNQTNPFAFLDAEIAEANTCESVPEFQIEAYQVVSIGALNGTCRRREVIDTIYIKNGNFEFAKEKAQNKADITAQVLKISCMVVEKLERIVSAHYKE